MCKSIIYVNRRIRKCCVSFSIKCFNSMYIPICVLALFEALYVGQPKSFNNKIERKIYWWCSRNKISDKLSYTYVLLYNLCICSPNIPKFQFEININSCIYCVLQYIPLHDIHIYKYAYVFIRVQVKSL